MPKSGGLPSVVQPFATDLSDYTLAGAVQENRTLLTSVTELSKQVEAMSNGLRQMGQLGDFVAGGMSKVASQGRTLADVINDAADASQKLASIQKSLADDATIARIDALRESIRATAAEQLGFAESVREAYTEADQLRASVKGVEEATSLANLSSQKWRTELGALKDDSRKVAAGTDSITSGFDRMRQGTERSLTATRRQVQGLMNDLADLQEMNIEGHGAALAIGRSGAAGKFNEAFGDMRAPGGSGGPSGNVAAQMAASRVIAQRDMDTAVAASMKQINDFMAAQRAASAPPGQTFLATGGQGSAIVDRAVKDAQARGLIPVPGKDSGGGGEDAAALVAGLTSRGGDGSSRLYGIGSILAGALGGHMAGGGAGAAIAGAGIASAIGMMRGGGGRGGGTGAALGGFFGPNPGGGGGIGATFTNTVAPFLARWIPIAHYVVMGLNEVMATIGPAAVAAGTAAMVGVQGYEQFVPRAKAVFATAESLGGSLGKTAGQAWGLGASPLQSAQNLATGAAFEIAGAGINITKAGAGKGFLQQGTNTVNMLDTGFARLTEEFQSGLGDKLAGATAGGTAYLKQLGDIFGNVGQIFLKAAPNLPGVGGDYLSILQGGTSAISKVFGTLSGLGVPGGPNLLGGLLAFEAGGRLGAPLVAAPLAAGVTRVGEVLGRAGGSIADAGFVRTGVRIGAIGAGAEAAGTGISALPATAIAAAAAATYMVVKTIQEKTPAQQTSGILQAKLGQDNFTQAYGDLVTGMNVTSKKMNLASNSLSESDILTGEKGNLFKIPKGLHVGGGNILAQAGSATGALFDIMGNNMNSPSLGAILVNSAKSWLGKMPSAQDTYRAELAQQQSQFVNLLGAGSTVQGLAQQTSLGGISMPSAYNLADMAQLQLGNAFTKKGTLTAPAKTMISNLMAGYAPMLMNGGEFGAAVGAQTAMSGLSHTQLSSVNSAFDSLMGTVQGGPGGAASLFQMLGGAPVARRSGGLQYKPPPALKGMADALTSFTTAAGAGAWSTFASTSQPSMVSAVQSQLDQFRTMQTMGASSAGQAKEMGAFEMEQLLPMAKKSPAALATLSTLAQQFGGPSVIPGTGKGVQAENYQNLAKWMTSAAGSSDRFNQNMTRGTQAMSSISRDSNQFVQQMEQVANSNAIGKAADDMNRFASSVNKSNSSFSGSSLKSWVKDLVQAGLSAQNIQGVVGTKLQQTGIGGTLARKIELQVSADISKAQAEIDGVHGKNVKISAVTTGVQGIQAAINAVHGKTVTITVNTINRIITQAIGALTPSSGGIAPMTLAGAPPGMRLTSGNQHSAGFLVPGFGGGDKHLALLEGGEAVVPKHLTGMVAPLLSAHKVPGFAAGGFVGQSVYGGLQYWGANSSMGTFNPAYYASLLARMNSTRMGIPGNPTGGGGPHFPVVHPMIAQALASGNPSGSSSTLAQVKSEISKAWKFLDQLYKEENSASGSRLTQLKTQIRDFWKNTLDPLYKQENTLKAGGPASAKSKQTTQQLLTQVNEEVAKSGIGKKFAVEVIKGLTGAFKNMGPQSGTAAQAMMNHISAEIAYAQSTTATAKQGAQLSNMDVTPGTGNGTVQEQLQSYLSTMNSFSKDMKTLSKAGLSKDLQKQLYAAGPVQGDALAQSILQGPGGVKAANQLNASISKMASKLGAQAAVGQFGGTLAPNLKSGTFVNNNISINIGGGKGGGGLGDLTPKELSQLVQLVQQALLKQAKRNRKTGVQLPGKKA